MTHCSHSSVSHSALFKSTSAGSKAHAFDHSNPLPLGLMEGPVCLLGRGQGQHGSHAGVEVRLLWEEEWEREGLAGVPKPRELTTCAPAFLAVHGHRQRCVHYFLLRALPGSQVPVV